MHPITIHKTLCRSRDGQVVLADDAQRRSFVGTSIGEHGGFMFVQIDRVTLLELERGMVDIHTVVAERGVGMTFEAPAAAVADGPARDTGPT